jgi:hypothetical protein
MSARRFVLPAILATALAAAAFALRGKGRLPDTPEEAVKAFFTAAESSDAPAYLSLLSGPLRGSFEESQRQLGAIAFRESLRSSVTGLKGFAASRAGESAEDRATLDVELVFADRSERQRFRLIRESRGWTIAAIDRAEVEKPGKPYGATVFEISPTNDAIAEPSSSPPESTGQ